MKKKRQMPVWLYDRLFKFWTFFAFKILHVPFAVYYSPPAESRRVLGITFAWTPGYAQRIKALEPMEQELALLRQQVANNTEEKGDSDGKGVRHEGSV